MLARINLQRDGWGDLPAQIVYICSSHGAEELHRFAPDFMHWRALLQPLTSDDLPVATWRTYLAWCIDEYSEREGDRVLRGGLRAQHDPLLVDLPKPDGVRRFSTWVREHFRGVIGRAPTGDPRHPAKSLAQQWATHALVHNDVTAPAPLLVTLHDVPEFLSRQKIPGTSTRIEELRLRHPGAPTIAFLIDGDGPVVPAQARAITHMGLKTFVITDRTEAWQELDWPSALVLAVLDPLSCSPSRPVVGSLVSLLAKYFSAEYLQRWLGLAPSALSRFELAERLTEQMLRQGQINSHFFDHLLKVRPRGRAEIERVREAFVGLLADPGAPSDPSDIN